MGHVLGRRPAFSRPIDIRNVETRRKNALKRPGHRKIVRLSLQSILAEYIQHATPLISPHSIEGDKNNELDHVLASVFRSENVQYLKKRGYDVEDVSSWAWIVTSETSELAASRLIALETDYRNRRGPNSPGIPSFIYLFLLKPNMRFGLNTFRVLLIRSLQLITGRPLSPTFEAISPWQATQKPDLELSKPRIDLMTCANLVDHLIEHARRVWPEPLPIITHTFAAFLKAEGSQPNVQHIHTDELSRQDQSELNKLKTKLANKCLWLLSKPSNIHPFRSIYLHQQAQFELLRAMATHNPVLPISRLGYRGVAAVQIAHKKTEAERQSAELKAPSWPPWKEERLGIDSQRGNEGVRSRAIQVLSQMTEAGYSNHLWEEYNKILAGWDTDGSPTVQTRTLSPRSTNILNYRYAENHWELWVARIRATRTVREAWACFLSCRNLSSSPDVEVYHAMAIRLIRGTKLIWTKPNDHSDALPGDGPEAYPEPSSARDIIYVHTEPPTVPEFLDEMRSQGFRFRRRLLALLLQTAQSFQEGMDYLRNSNLSEKEITALCTVWEHEWQYKRYFSDAVKGLPPFLFASFIKFLSRFFSMNAPALSNEVFTSSRPQSLIDMKKRSRPYTHRGSPDSIPVCVLTDQARDYPINYHPGLLFHVIRLLKTYPSHSPRAWEHLMASFAYAKFNRRGRSVRNQSLYRITVWYATVEVLGWMQERNVESSSPEIFHLLCRGFTQAVDAGAAHPHFLDIAFELRDQSPTPPSNPEPLDTLIENGLPLLKQKFDGMVLPNQQGSIIAQGSGTAADHTEDSFQGIPPLLHIPSYATLHTFARALGAVGDDEGLLDLLRWMSRTSVSLDEVADEQLNGSWMRLQTLLAIRVFLERLHGNAVNSADSAKVQEAFDIVSQTPGWTWPDDEEVDSYLSR